MTFGDNSAHLQAADPLEAARISIGQAAALVATSVRQMSTWLGSRDADMASSDKQHEVGTRCLMWKGFPLLCEELAADCCCVHKV